MREVKRQRCSYPNGKKKEEGGGDVFLPWRRESAVLVGSGCLYGSKPIRTPLSRNEPIGEQQSAIIDGRD